VQKRSHLLLGLWVLVVILTTGTGSLLAGAVGATTTGPPTWNYLYISAGTYTPGADSVWTLTGSFNPADITSVGTPGAGWSYTIATNQVKWFFSGTITPGLYSGFSVASSLPSGLGAFTVNPSDAGAGTIAAPAVPEASTFALFGVGLVGLWGLTRRKRK
jgi:hypothetical protein